MHKHHIQIQQRAPRCDFESAVVADTTDSCYPPSHFATFHASVYNYIIIICTCVIYALYVNDICIYMPNL